MDGPRRPGPTPTDADGDSPAWRPSPGFLVAALVIIAGGGVLLWMSSPSPAPVAMAKPQPAADSFSAAPMPPVTAEERPTQPPVSAAASASGSAPTEPQQIPRVRDPDGDQTPDLADYVNPGEKPTMGEVIDRLHQAGVRGGLGAFSPPGTRPPLVGLAVPEDFALPEGYVRHYQATDDGQRIEPILMFSPDVRWPFAIPADRVVPPELAPPGLPIRRIEIPAPTEPGK